MRLVLYYQAPSSQLYDKDTSEQAKVIIFNKYMMEYNTLLFEPSKPKISHSRVGQAQVMSTYVHTK